MIILPKTSPITLTLVFVQWATEVTLDISSHVSGMYGASDDADICHEVVRHQRVER